MIADGGGFVRVGWRRLVDVGCWSWAQLGAAIPRSAQGCLAAAAETWRAGVTQIPVPVPPLLFVFALSSANYRRMLRWSAFTCSCPERHSCLRASCLAPFYRTVDAARKAQPAVTLHLLRLLSRHLNLHPSPTTHPQLSPLSLHTTAPEPGFHTRSRRLHSFTILHLSRQPHTTHLESHSRHKWPAYL